MAVVVLASASGSPGVTATAVGLASVWPRPVLLVDADPVGGQSILAGFFQGRLPAGGGLGEVALGQRSGDLAGAIAASAVALPGTQAHVLPGACGHLAAQALKGLWPPLLAQLRALEATGQDVVVDAGRLGMEGSPEPLIYGADLALLVMGSSLRAMSGARSWAKAWRATFDDVGAGSTAPVALVVGPGRPYGGKEIASVLPIAVLGSLPWDPAGAAVFADGAQPGRRFASGPLMRALTQTREAMSARLRGPDLQVRSADAVEAGSR